MAAQREELVSRVEASLDRGLAFEALNLVAEARQVYPDDVRLAQLHGLALARLGATEKARTCLEALVDRGHRDGETIGILARVYKDLARATGSAEVARLSRDTYLSGFRDSGEIYLGINAATMSSVMGDTQTTTALAREVVAAAGEGSNDYWTLATLGEAHLLLGEPERALERYGSALRVAGHDQGKVASSYQQVVLLSCTVEVPAELLRLLQPDAVVVFTGHMIDRHDRPEQRFPAAATEAVKGRIVALLDRHRAGVGYCSAACGADLLFAEAMLERDAEVNLYLPFRTEDFLATSVSWAGPHWEDRFFRVVESASVRHLTEEGYYGTEDLFTFVGEVTMGMAILRANVLGIDPLCMAVCAPGEALTGGTENMLRRWPFPEALEVIDPLAVERGEHAPAVQACEAPSFPSPPEGVTRCVRSILFADVVGVGAAQEELAPFFMLELLRSVEERLAAVAGRPEIFNTWGDALLAVCVTPRDAVELALMLGEVFRGSDWTVGGERAEIDLRVSLHAGPIFVGCDPVGGRRSAYGAHINRTARMRPVTVPGCIYGSEAFAASLVVETGELYRLEYVGQLELADDLGLQHMYRISRRGDFSALIDGYRRQRLVAGVGTTGDVGGPAGEILPGVGADIDADDDAGSFDWLLPHMQEELFGKDEVLFERGATADKIFYIDEGRLSLAELNQHVSSGDIVGETEVFSPFRTRSCTARAETDLKTRTISHQRMIDFLYKRPAFLLQLIQLCVRRFVVNLSETIAERERIASELEVARAIQTGMLPRREPDDARVELAAMMEPAREVGGDFYDFFLVDDDHLCVVIGDVSGKGMPAALFMVVSRTLIRTEALRGLATEEVLRHVNDRLVPENEQSMFVTVFLAVLDLRSGELRIACGGHNPPLGRGGYMTVESNVFLGAMDGLDFVGHAMTLEPGEQLLLYTDGVTEAENDAAGQFGEERLATLMAEIGDRPARSIIDTVREKVAAFAGGAPQSDDITMVALRWVGDP